MAEKMIQTRVIGGKYRGLKLDLPSLLTTRSSKSILRESLFNSLSSDIIDANFIEVFAGSGSVMIEAISRGAKHGYGIEFDKKAFGILLKNCQKINGKYFTCKRGDSFEILPEIVTSLDTPAYLYLDPPFEYRENMEKIYQKCFDLLLRLDETKIICAIFENMSCLKMPQNIGNFQLFKSKKFGKSSLNYYVFKD